VISDNEDRSRAKQVDIENKERQHGNGVFAIRTGCRWIRHVPRKDDSINKEERREEMAS
jgi:hypothetical protein